VSAAASALNQWWEIRWDRRMRRTRERPLAAARISARGALIYSALTCAGGLFLLIRFTHPLAALLAFTTLVTYLLVYTPLKRKLTLNTLVGAVPGALPPLIGWAAATGGLAPEAWILFGILFAWQVPHFLAIAWLHRSDYSRGGFQMLPVIDPSGERTARMVTLYSLSMVPVSLAPALAGLSGWIYLIAALLLGSGFFLCALLFERRPTRATARRLYLASLAYLPLLFTVMIVDPTVPRPLFP
ncbi:MAG: heme o synthase, partial [Planctomycetota bacterium]